MMVGWLIFNFFLFFFVGGQLQTLFAEKIDDERRRAAHMLPDHHPHTSQLRKIHTQRVRRGYVRDRRLTTCEAAARVPGYFCCFAPRGAPRQKKASSRPAARFTNI